jgi:hypothetical protein
MKAKATIIILCAILFGCKKDNTKVTLNGALTDCPANTTCTYNYYDNADFTNGSQIVAGNNRVFWYKSDNVNTCNISSQFYLKTPLSDNNFDFNASQVAGGQVLAYDLICPCCDVPIITKPIGGEIKGKRTDATHWLINATIVFGYFADTPVDTLVVNQYFTSAKLP